MNASPFESLAHNASSAQYRFLARVILERKLSLETVAVICGQKPEAILASFSIYGKASVSASAIAKRLGLNPTLLRAAEHDDGSSLSAADLRQLHNDAIRAIRSSSLFSDIRDQLASDADAVLRKNPAVRRMALRKFLGAWIPVLGPSIVPPAPWESTPPAVYALLQVLEDSGLLGGLLRATPTAEEGSLFDVTAAEVPPVAAPRRQRQ